VIWGTASSSLQCEGAAPASDWAGRERAGGAAASTDGNGFRVRWRDDLQLLADHGVGVHRLTIEWARLEPSRGSWDDDEVQRYRRVLETARDVGVEIWVTLHHLTLPGWFSEDERGFRDNRMTRHVWPAHVDRIAETFGDLVSGWVPIDQPSAYASFAWADEDDRRVGLANVRAANREAARLLRTAHAPVVASHPPGAPADELRLDLDVFDGVGLVHPATDDGNVRAALQVLADELGDVAMWITSTGVGTRDEDERAHKLRATAEQVVEAQRDGIDVRGALWWTAIDGYEPATGFAVPWGLFDRDRNPRPALDELSSLRS
jgi:beta-glucosidase